VIIAGGVYYERCLTPPVEELFGSGGRAAVALSSITEVTLHTFFPPADAEDVVLNMAAFGISTTVHPSSAVAEFFYNFPLSMPRMAPVPMPKANPVRVAGNKIIRFGCIEGEIVVDAEVAVYDPQSGNNPQAFGANGSRADRLAIVLNRGELYGLTGAGNDQPLEVHVRSLVDQPEVVVVKDGVRGAHVFERGVNLGTVPVYKSESVYKIGSGDIFTAMFGFGWTSQALGALEAADAASRHVAAYVESRIPNMGNTAPDREPVEIREREKPHRIYIAGSFFSAEHVWLVDEVRTAIEALGVPCFSPMHDVGIGTDKSVAETDLRELIKCDVLLALISDNDPGTLMEIGYAISEGIPVFAVSENPGPQDLTMVEGSGAIVFKDLATAIYHAAWAALE
jgi:hypothetical protein